MNTIPLTTTQIIPGTQVTRTIPVNQVTQPMNQVNYVTQPLNQVSFVAQPLTQVTRVMQPVNQVTHITQTTQKVPVTQVSRTNAANVVSKPKLEDGKATVNLKPVELKLTYLDDVGQVCRMVPYCKFKLGWKSGKSTVGHYERGIHVFMDVVSLERKGKETSVKLKIKNKDGGNLEDRIGMAEILLEDVVAAGGLIRAWYPLKSATKTVGEILMEVEYRPHP